MKKLILLICLVPLLVGVKIRQDGCNTAYRQGMEQGINYQYCSGISQRLERLLENGEKAHRSYLEYLSKDDKYAVKLSLDSVAFWCDMAYERIDAMIENKCYKYTYWEKW